MDIGIFFTAGRVISCIGNYIGFIDTIDSKIDKIVKADLNTALRILKEIQNSSSSLQIELIKEAASKFRRALSLEKEIRLCISYLGLAMCQFHLGELKNFNITLQELVDYEIPLTIGDKILNVGKPIYSLDLMEILPFFGFRSLFLIGKILRENQIKEKMEIINEIKLQAVELVKGKR